MGKNASPEQEKAASIEKHVAKDYPRTFIWCGEADATVSPDNTKMMIKALKEAGISGESHIYPGIGHGVGTGIGSATEG